MFLKEENQIKLSNNHLSILNNNYNKRNNCSTNFDYYFKKSFDNENEERISLTEHSNILSEYEQELNFLGMKRKNINFLDNNNISKDNTDNNSSSIICLDNKIADLQRNKNINNISKERKKRKKMNEDNIKISELFKLYHYLFIKSGLDCSKPSSFVDYLANEINGSELNLSLKGKHRINFEQIKKIVLNLKNENDENALIYKIFDDYFHCSFKNSIIEKIIDKINKILINKKDDYIEKKNNINIINIINDNNSFSCNFDTCDKSSKNKKDKISHSSLISDKLKNNIYKSSFSLVNDVDIFKSIIYMSNKYSQNSNKANINDKTIINSFEKFIELLKSFKEENKENSNKIDKKYLKDLLKNKKLKKFIDNDLLPIKESLNNNILKIFDKNNFYKLINLLFINDITKDKNKFDIISNLNQNEAIKDNDISSFLILINFLIGLIIINKYPNQTSSNDFCLLNLFFQYIKQFDNSLSNKIIRKEPKQKIKKIKIKEKHKNRIKIKIKSNKESLNNNSISLTEEQKIEEESKVKNNNNIIKMFFHNNDDISLDDNSPKPNKDNNNIIINNYSLNDNNCEDSNYINYNLINKNIKSLNEDKDKTRMKKEKKKLRNNKISNDKIIYNDYLNIFQKNLLNELSLGNDIFKISYSKIREKKVKTKNEKEIELELEQNKEFDFNFSDKNTNIKIENNTNNHNDSETKIINKKGNKIIIFAEDFFEGNNDYSNNINCS